MRQSRLPLGQKQSFERLSKDRYVRIIALVFFVQINVNLELVKQVFAWRYVPRCIDDSSPNAVRKCFFHIHDMALVSWLFSSRQAAWLQ